ncbi:hypothetical protein BKA93DRAFT_603527 [Sparassis latifolia]
MTTPLPPFPPKGGFIGAVNESSRALRQRAGIEINHKKIKLLLTSGYFTSTYARLRESHGMAMPLKFPSLLAELNLLSILSLLNFGSGYRVPLHVATGRGAFDNIRALVLGLYISSSTGTGEGNYLSATGMRDIKEHTIADLMGVTDALHVEHAHESVPAVTVGELGGPIWELVKLLTQALNETGTVLVNSGYPDLGSFVLEALNEGDKLKNSAESVNHECDVILERFVRAIPAFRDMAVVNGQPVYCFKKALLAIHAIALRFGSAESLSEIPIPRTSELPVFVDNVIPSILVHLGIINLEDSTPSLGLRDLFPRGQDDSTIRALLSEVPAAPPADTRTTKDQEVPKEGPVLTSVQAFALRAAAIDAGQAIIATARDLNANEESYILKQITLPELDAWLWSAAKDRPDWRNLERFVLRDTVYF